MPSSCEMARRLTGMAEQESVAHVPVCGNYSLCMPRLRSGQCESHLSIGALCDPVLNALFAASHSSNSGGFDIPGFQAIAHESDRLWVPLLGAPVWFSELFGYEQCLLEFYANVSMPPEKVQGWQCVWPS